MLYLNRGVLPGIRSGGCVVFRSDLTRFANPFIPSPSAVNVLNVDIERYSFGGKKTKLICLYTFVFPFEKVPDCDFRPSTLHCERPFFFPQSLARAIKKGKIVQINKNWHFFSPHSSPWRPHKSEPSRRLKYGKRILRSNATVLTLILNHIALETKKFSKELERYIFPLLVLFASFWRYY